MAYLVDTNVFIEAKNRYYAFDLPPGEWFWELLVTANEAGLVASAHRMREELMPADDELTAWAKARGPEFWLPEDGDVVAAVRELMAWAQGAVAAGRYTQAAVNEFAEGDVMLVATAMAGGHVVVTHERADPNARKRIKIPDACAAFGVACVDPFVMLKDVEEQVGE